MKPKSSISAISTVQTQIESLLSRLEILADSPSRDNSTLLKSLDDYETQFQQYEITEKDVDFALMDKKSLGLIRQDEWKNYKIFTSNKSKLNNSTTSKKYEEIKTLLDKYLKKHALLSLNQITNQNKDAGTASNKNAFSLKNFFGIQTAYAADNKNIVHKKVTLDTANPRENGKKMNCWGYESWVNLETGDLRQEIEVSFGSDCRKETDITSGKTGKKLALNPKEKLAEWIVPPKIGIGSETTKDPFTDFKTKLNDGTYIPNGTDVVNGRNVYIFKHIDYEKDYSLIYLDATSYLPAKEAHYGEEKIITPNPDDSSRSIVTSTGKLLLNESFIFVAGEIIANQDALANLFDQTIPADYQMVDWVPQG